MGELKTVSDIASSLAAEFFKEPLVLLCLDGLGLLTVTLGCASCALAISPLGWLIATVGMVATAFFIALNGHSSQFSTEELAARGVTSQEENSNEVKYITQLLDAAFNECEAAREFLEKAQKHVQKQTGYPKVLVNLVSAQNAKKEVPFEAQCQASLGKIDLNASSKDEFILHYIMFELMNLTRSGKERDGINQEALGTKCVNKVERQLKIAELARKMEYWEFGTMLDLEKVYRKIIKEVAEKLESNPIAQHWHSAALNFIKMLYEGYLNIEAAHQLGILDSLRKRQTTDLERVKIEEMKRSYTLKDVDVILQKREPNPSKRADSVRQRWAKICERNGHTKFYRDVYNKYVSKID